MNNVWAKENCAKCGCLLDDDLNCAECEICNTVVGTDMVNSPPHYNTIGIECIEAMKAMSYGAILPSSHAHYCWQNAFKYIWRHPYKGTALEDLKKCEYYLKRLINEYDEATK